MTNSSCAADTNILIYLHDKADVRKRNIAENIIAENPKIPAQVVSEYLNVTRRILNLSKIELIIQCVQLLRDCEVIPISLNTLNTALSLINRYDFQMFDSIIVATALNSDCDVLYSEDMQHGLIINKMTIVNPFI